MNKIKSIYMTMLPIVMMMIVGFSIYKLIKTPFDLSWIASMLTAMPILMFLMQTMIFTSKPRTHPFLPMHTVMVVMGLILAMVVFIFPSIQLGIELNHVALALTELGFILHIAYLFWYSSLQRPIQHSLKLGEPLPSFSVYKDNTKVVSESFLGFSTIIIFYRGNWCPFCMAQIKELAQQYRQLILTGVKIVLISPQPEKITETLAKRFNVPFIFLNDKKNTAATNLGLNHNNGVPAAMITYDSNTVYPTVIVTNKVGKIIYLDETRSFRNRPEPKEYLDILLNENLD